MLCVGCVMSVGYILFGVGDVMCVGYVVGSLYYVCDTVY